MSLRGAQGALSIWIFLQLTSLSLTEAPTCVPIALPTLITPHYVDNVLVPERDREPNPKPTRPFHYTSIPSTNTNSSDDPTEVPRGSDYDPSPPVSPSPNPNPNPPPLSTKDTSSNFISVGFAGSNRYVVVVHRIQNLSHLSHLFQPVFKSHQFSASSAGSIGVGVAESGVWLPLPDCLPRKWMYLNAVEFRNVIP